MQTLAGILRGTEGITGLPFGRIAGNLVASGGTLGASAVQDPAARLAWATEAYLRGLAVFNDGRSFVLQVSFRSTDPQLAATVANRHLALYIEQQRAAKREELRNAHAWLEQEVQLLSARVRDAEQAVQAYREDHRLFTAGGISAAARILSDSNGQLAAARSDLATKEGRLRSSLAGVRRQAADTDVDVADSGTVSRLREQEATVRRREAEMATRLGSRHPDVLAVRAELREIQSKTAEEVQKILPRLRRQHRRAQTASANCSAASPGWSSAWSRATGPRPAPATSNASPPPPARCTRRCSPASSRSPPRPASSGPTRCWSPPPSRRSGPARRIPWSSSPSR